MAGRARGILLGSAMLAAGTATVFATPPLGFIVNQIFASGFVSRGIHQHVELNRNPDGTVTPWHLELELKGDTDFYSQRLVLSPGGYSGWHSHPGLLIGVVKSGSIDLYDGQCKKRTLGPGQTYTENDQVHAIINRGAVDADLYISYLIKHGAPRRLEENAPECAVDTGIP